MQFWKFVVFVVFVFVVFVVVDDDDVLIVSVVGIDA